METIVEGLKDFLKNTPDEERHANALTSFLNGVLRIKDVIPPTTEIISVIRREKPVLFYYVKGRVLSSSPLSMILSLDMNYDLAKERLGMK